MNGWAYVSVAVLLVVGVIVNALFVGAAFLIFHRAAGVHTGALTTIVVKAPSFISGPAIEMSLPSGSNLTSSSVDADGGNWWYDGADARRLHILIAASKFSSGQPDLSSDYFRRVIRIVERSSGNQVTAVDAIQVSKVGSYTGLQAAYDIQPPDESAERAVALLIRRESDDLLVVLYGDKSVGNEVDRAATEMFHSLHPRPTPPQYDVHSAELSPSIRNYAFRIAGVQ